MGLFDSNSSSDSEINKTTTKTTKTATSTEAFNAQSGGIILGKGSTLKISQAPAPAAQPYFGQNMTSALGMSEGSGNGLLQGTPLGNLDNSKGGNLPVLPMALIGVGVFYALYRYIA